MDLVQRWTFVAPDGGYGEGPYYQRYAGQNLLPFARAWNHATARPGRGTSAGARIPDLWTSPWYRQTQRWLLDMTLPNGALAPVDDGNVDFSYYFGAAPTDPEDAAAFAWRWANAPTPYDTDGSIDLAADSLIAYDDTVVPAPPSGSPTRFYFEGGNAVFRSGWDADATTAVVLGEHGAAMELGRDRDGLGKIASAAHEQADTGSFSLARVRRAAPARPGLHDVPGARPRRQGHRPQHDPRRTARARSTRSSRRSSGSAISPGSRRSTARRRSPSTRDTAVARHRARHEHATRTPRSTGASSSSTTATSIVADTLQAAAGTTPTFTWPLHGNGGGTSGGTFAPTASGGQWTNGAARLDAAVATDAGPVVVVDAGDEPRRPGPRAADPHHARRDAAPRPGPTTRGLVVAYPSRSGEAAPTVETLLGVGRRHRDPHHRPGRRPRSSPCSCGADGVVTIQDNRSSTAHRGSATRTQPPRSATVGVGPSIRYAGTLGLRVSPTHRRPVRRPGRAVGSAPSGSRSSPAAPTARAALRQHDAGVSCGPGADGAVTLRAGAGQLGARPRRGRRSRGRRPSARSIRLAGRGCDVDGDRLTPQLGARRGAAGERMVAHRHRHAGRRRSRVDAAGPVPRAAHRHRRPRRRRAAPSEVEIFGGPRCTGDRLTWSDPRCP